MNKPRTILLSAEEIHDAIRMSLPEIPVGSGYECTVTINDHDKRKMWAEVTYDREPTTSKKTTAKTTTVDEEGFPDEDGDD